MKKITKILVPIDFSQPSANALRYALRLGGLTGAEIQVLNVLAPQGEALDYPVMVARATHQRLRTTRIQINKFVKTGLTALGQELKELPSVQSEIEIGYPVNTICDFANREDTTLIVIGSRGENRSRLEKILGSVAAGVVQKAKCAVLVIPEEVNFTAINTMTYATDVNDADPYEIWKAIKLLEPFKPNINVVHVNLEKDGDLKAWEKMNNMKDFFDDKTSIDKFEVFHVPGISVETELNEFIEDNPSDLLVMYQPHHDFWDRLFYKSNTKKMAIHTKVPLLVMKENS